ncbi:MAG: hypothetical protein ACXVZP_02890 [Gaiellaceae bacterium]
MNRYFANIGDVWKHLVLAQLLALEPPEQYWETHAGSASYPLGHSPDRDYGVYWFVDHAQAAPELAGSRYATELRRLVGGDGYPPDYPGSALWAMRALGKGASYLLCDLDPGSSATLRAAAAELNLASGARVLEADGMSTVLAEAGRYPGDPAGVVVTVDPFEPFVAPGGLSALEVAASLIEGGFRVVYWYGYDAPDQRSWPVGALQDYADRPGVSLWCGDLVLSSALGQSEQQVAALLADAQGPGAGCGVVCGNFLRSSTESCEHLGLALAEAWRDSRLPNGSPGRLDFAASTL